METIDFTSGSYAEYNEGFNEKYLKFKAGDRVRISKYKKIFAKGYTANYSEDFFVISKIKNTILWTYGIRDLNDEEITEMFNEKEQQKTNEENLEQKNLLKERVINGKSNGKDMIINLIV